MKIGIISDTHSKIKLAKEAIDMLIENGAEFIIHAGDIVEVEILELLKNSKLRYVAVYGNNDAHLAQYHNNYNLVQEPYYFKLSNLKFKLMHLPFYMSGDADIIIYGHTHKFDIEYTKKALFLNSGEVCARSKPISECAMLEIVDDKYIVTHYTKKTDKKKKSSFKEKSFSFKREH
jgi:putative phosphoesterase